MRFVIASATMATALAALPAQGAPHAGSSKAMTIRLVSITTQFKVLKDKAPTSEVSKGDVMWAKSTLRNDVPQFGKPKGAIVGSDVSTYTVVSEAKGDVKVTAKLPGGTLRAGGRIGQERVQRIPVLGGTGVFSGARGVAESISLNAAGDKARNVYRLRLP